MDITVKIFAVIGVAVMVFVAIIAAVSLYMYLKDRFNPANHLKVEQEARELAKQRMLQHAHWFSEDQITFNLLMDIALHHKPIDEIRNDWRLTMTKAGRSALSSPGSVTESEKCPSPADETPGRSS